MAKLFLLVALIVLSIFAITEAQFLFSCPANCRDTTCSSVGCTSCDTGYCLYYDISSKFGICVNQCPSGMHCTVFMCSQDRN